MSIQSLLPKHAEYTENDSLLSADIMEESGIGTNSYSSSNSNTIENDVWFPSEQAADVDVQHANDLIDIKVLEELLLEQVSYRESGPRIRKKQQTKHKSMYGAMNQDDGSCCRSSDFRYTFYSSHYPSTMHTKSFEELLPTIKDYRGTCFWIDIHNPVPSEMKAIQRIFRIHPLTAEDITTEEPREKCEVFNHYYFVSFRTFEADPCSTNYLHPIGFYILIFDGFVLSFSLGASTPHSANVRKRMVHLKDCLTVTPDWICYGLLDDIIDTFVPLIRAIEFEVDSIDELVLILKETEQSDMLRRIGYCRKRMMSLLRLLVAKSDVIKTLIKRGGSVDHETTDHKRPAVSQDVIIYLGDIQDHVVAMLQSLNHYEKISSRSHSNYLAQISIEMTQTNNEINDVLSKLTALGSVLVPMNLVTGMWGMNVQVPGQFREDLTWFFGIMASIFTFCVLTTLLMKSYKIL